MLRNSLLCIFAASAITPLALAQNHLITSSAPMMEPAVAMSSSSASDLSAGLSSEAIAPVPLATPRKAPAQQHGVIATSVSTFGPGFEFSVPMGSKTALRAGYHGMSLSHGFETEGVPFTASIDSKTAALQLDYAPFGGNFRISPGMLAMNNINVKAVGIVAGGSKISLGDGEYTSSKSDPLKATATMKFGYNLSPMLTMGFRSILPQRWNLVMPVEFGAVYNGGPKLAFDMQGSACDANGYCGKISTNPEAIQDIDREKKSWADSISKYSFLPVVSIGLGYRFGGTGGAR